MVSKGLGAGIGTPLKVRNAILEMGCSHHLGTQRLHEISVVYADLFCVVAPIAHVLVGLSAIHLEMVCLLVSGTFELLLLYAAALATFSAITRNRGIDSMAAF